MTPQTRDEGEPFGPTVSPPQAATVVIVDDEPSVRRLLATAVTALGYSAQVASSADSALSMIRTTQPDIVLCDITMPGHDGAWLIDNLVHVRVGLPIIIVTGRPYLDLKLRFHPGVVGVLVKPFQIHDLRAMLSRAMGSLGRPTPSPTGDPS